MPIVNITRSTIQMESDGRTVTFHGEAYLPGHGSPDFVVTASETKYWNSPYNRVAIDKETLDRLLEQLKVEMKLRQMTVEIE